MKFRVGDGLWIRPVDVGAALAARSYAGDGELVLEVSDAFCPWNDGRYGLDGSKTTASPDLRLTAADLGTVFLGEASRSRISCARAGSRRSRRARSPSETPSSAPTESPGAPRSSEFLLPFRPVFRSKALLVGLFCCSVLASPALAGYEESPADSHQEARWLVPMDGPLGSPFGYRWGRNHDGIDIEGWYETRVRATQTGRVTHVGWLGDYSGLRPRRQGAPRGRDRDDVRAPLARLRQARGRGHGPADHRPRGLHRLLHRHAPPFPGVAPRQADRPARRSSAGTPSPASDADRLLRRREPRRPHRRAGARPGVPGDALERRPATTATTSSSPTSTAWSSVRARRSS